MRTLTSGFTLIEVLVVVVIIMVLAGLLLPAIAVVRRRADVTATRQTLTLLFHACESYQAEDRRHRYPIENVDRSLTLRPLTPGAPAVLALFDRAGLFAKGRLTCDDKGRLLDAWGSPFQYSLTRPVGSFTTWNWDSVNARERRWGRRPQGNGALPYPYLWSLGVGGLTSLPTDWVTPKD